MKDLVDKVNSSYNVAIVFFLFAGAAYFIFYSLKTSKYSYILLAITVYSLGFVVRKYLLKNTDNKGYTEPGIFFMSFLLTAYLLYLTNLDTEIGSHLPDKILLQTGSSFLFITAISFISSFQQGFNKFMLVLLICASIGLIHFCQSSINMFFLNNPQVSHYIIGAPVIYLIILVFGLSKFTNKILP